MADIKIIMPVGTSIIANGAPNQNIRNLSSQSYDKMLPVITGIVDNFYRNKEADNEFSKRKINQKDLNPAEISSLYAFWKKEKSNLENKKIKIILLHSPNIGKACANGIENLIMNKRYFPHNSITWDVHFEALQKLNPNCAQEFPKAMDELADIIWKEVKEFSGEVYLNISGGYKALVPYMTMMAMVLGKGVRVFYLYEDSPEIIYLPAYPMSFSLLEWRDWRGLLLPFTMENVINDSQKDDFFKALEGSKVGSLIEKEKPHKLNSIGRLVSDLYEKGKGKTVSEFGQGFVLLNLFEDIKFKEYLSENCIPLWYHLSAGDHIPETVEHGRGHVQRLLELAQQFLIAADDKNFLSNEQLFVLICSIWLHDLGHTGNYFTFEGNGGLIQNKDDPESINRQFVHRDPEDVRKYHNFLSYELIKSESVFLFPNINKQLHDKDIQILLRSVELACLYHRKSMPITGEKSKKDEVWKVTKGIQDFEDSKKVIKGFPEVAALLRVLDGAENQQERTISKEYYDVMLWVLQRQAKAMQDLIDSSEKKSGEQQNLQTRINFKRQQKDHFIKHRLVRNVFIVREEPDNLYEEGIYGSGNNKTFVIGVYIVVNERADDFSKDKVIRKIVCPFLEEYMLVESLLKFRLALIYIQEENGSFPKKQIKITYEENKEPEEWKYELLNL